MENRSLWEKTKSLTKSVLLLGGLFYVGHELFEAHQATHDAVTNAIPETIGNAPEITDIQDSVYASTSDAGIMEAANDDNYAIAV